MLQNGALCRSPREDWLGKEDGVDPPAEDDDGVREVEHESVRDVGGDAERVARANQLLERSPLA
jgi:hypothetical protein